MSKQAPLLESVLVQAMGMAFTATVSFLLTLLLARQLGPEEFSLFATWLNLGALALIVIEGGWPTLVYRQLAQGDISASTQASLAMGLRHICFAYVCVVALAMVAAPLNDFLLAVCVATCMAAVAVMNLASAHMRGVGAFALESAWQCVGRAVSAMVIMFVVFFSLQASSSGVFAAWGLGLLLVLVTWGRSWLPRVNGLKVQHIVWSFEAWPLVPVALASMWMLKGDLLLMEGTGETKALYAACTRLTEAGLLMFAPVANVLLGRFSALCANQNGDGYVQARALARKFCALAMLSGATAVGLAVWLGEAGMTALFGTAYAGAGTLLPWVLAMLPFACSNLVLLQLATAQHKERDLLARLTFCGLLLAVGLPTLESLYDTIGAALAMAGCQAVLMGLLLGLTSHDTKR